MRRSMLAALTMFLLMAWPLNAQPAPWRLVQGSDGVLFVMQGNIKNRIVPAPMTEADQAVPEAPAWGDGVMAAPSGGKRIGETTVLTDPFGLHLAVTMNAIHDNVPPGRYAEPPVGRFAVVDWTVKNEGLTEATVNRLDFKLQTADGFTIGRDGRIVHEPDLTPGTIGPGQVARGWLIYDVPSNARIASAIYQPSSTRHVVIAVLP